MSINEKLNEYASKIIDKKLLDLNKDNIVILLEPMSHSLRHKIKDYLKDREDIKVITIGEENKDRRLFIVKHNSYNTKFNMQKRISMALDSFYNKNYLETIRILKNILMQSKYPNPYFYEILALSYLRINNYEQALKLLIIAQGLSEYTEKKYNYYELIDKLKERLAKDKKKNNKKEKEIEILGIKNMTIIAKEIYKYNGNIDMVGNKMNLSKEDILLIKLICARTYYYNGEIKKGDTLIKELEKEKNKPENIKKLLKETIKNKIFYKNRESNSNKELIKILNNIKTYK